MDWWITVVCSILAGVGMLIITKLSSKYTFKTHLQEEVEEFEDVVENNKGKIDRIFCLLDKHGDLLEQIQKAYSQQQEYTADMDEQRSKIDRVVLRASMRNLYEQYKLRDCITLEEFSEFMEMYEIYSKDLNGNGAMPTIAEKIKQLYWKEGRKQA